MAKLYFRYGVVNSSKTMNLLATAHNYRQQGKRVKIAKPKLDSRFGVNTVRSRAGLEKAADIVLDESTPWDDAWIDDGNIDCLLIDEVQFLTPAHIEEFRRIVDAHNVPIICYGLRTDFRTRLFEASRRLLEIADSIEEIKTTCAFCNRKATCNLKSVDGVATLDGPSVQLGCEELYQPACFRHFCNETSLVLGKGGVNVEDNAVDKSKDDESECEYWSMYDEVLNSQS
jgi:thymidine kinase